MAILQYERFENHMDVASPETVNDAEMVSDFYDENPYNDEFEERLSQLEKSAVSKESTEIEQPNKRNIDNLFSQESVVSNEGHIVFQAIADANPDYGEGGGKQYFIQGASELKEDGRLKLQSQIILDFDEKDIFKAGIRESVDSSYFIHFDTRNMTEERAEQSLYASGDKFEGSIGNMPEDLSEEELSYLEDNTIATEGLTSLEYETEPDGTKHEDRLTPLGNQEDSEGKNHPDSWSNPTDLESGKVYYQISPIFNDGNSETKSSYFTDEETINSCRDENALVSVSTLLQKLQIEPKKEMIIGSDGESKEEYVKSYRLSSYIFTGEEGKEKGK